MCGIYGQVGERLDEAAARRALHLLHHRGPDGSSIQGGARFLFGHTRLAILDLSEDAGQPMRTPDGRTWLTFNGEIFNHEELREELRALGHRFRTRSDTEVLLHAWREWGEDALPRLAGQFAFGVFDVLEDRLWLVRDRLGIKPLYYAAVPGGLVFASEPKALAVHPAVPIRMDAVAVSSYLSYRSPLGTRTLFEGIRSLPPATILELRRDGTRARVYWRLDPDRVHPRPFEEEQEELRYLVRRAVGQQVKADVSVAMFLSGGVDSSILAFEGSRVGGIRAAYTARVARAGYDETPAAREVAGRAGLSLYEIPVELDDHFTDLDALLRVRDQPIGMHNEIGMARLSSALAERHRVTLCGEGADELFLGYGRIFRSGFDWARGRLLRWFGAAGERARQRLEIRRRLSTELDFFLDGFTYWPWADKAPLLSPEVRRVVAEDAESIDVIRAAFERARRRGVMGQIAQVFVDVHLPNLLTMVDATTMMSSVEARVPYLDHRIAEAAWAIPESSRLAWRSRLAPVRALVRPVAAFSESLDEPKAHLRRTWAADLPSMVLRRRKMGFPMPLGAWLATERRAEIVSAICRPGSSLAAVFDLDRLARWAIDHEVSDGFGQRLWRLYSLERFAAMWF